jgi:hypothetical protein
MNMLILALALAAPAEQAPARPATAAAAEPPPGPVTVLKAPASDPLICKKETPVGSRLPVKVCLTAYDWQERRAASLRDMDQMVTKGNWP